MAFAILSNAYTIIAFCYVLCRFWGYLLPAVVSIASCHTVVTCFASFNGHLPFGCYTNYNSSKYLSSDLADYTD